MQDTPGGRTSNSPLACAPSPARLPRPHQPILAPLRPPLPPSRLRKVGTGCPRTFALAAPAAGNAHPAPTRPDAPQATSTLTSYKDPEARGPPGEAGAPDPKGERGAPAPGAPLRPAHSMSKLSTRRGAIRCHAPSGGWLTTSDHSTSASSWHSVACGHRRVGGRRSPAPGSPAPGPAPGGLLPSPPASACTSRRAAPASCSPRCPRPP